MRKRSNDKLMFSVLTLRQSRWRNWGKCKLIHSFVAKADNCLKFFFGCNLLDAKMETGHCCCLWRIGPSGQGTHVPPMWSSFTPQPKGKFVFVEGFIWFYKFIQGILHTPFLMRKYCLFDFCFFLEGICFCGGFYMVLQIYSRHSSHPPSQWVLFVCLFLEGWGLRGLFLFLSYNIFLSNLCD